MTRKCTICTHPNREEIDKQLLSGESYRSIAKHFGASESAIYRHQEHIPKSMVKAQEANEIARVDSLLDQVKNLREKALELLAKAEKSEDLRAAGVFLKELREQVKLWAELEGRLAAQNQVLILINNPAWIELRSLIIETLEPFPAAKKALVEALSKEV